MRVTARLKYSEYLPYDARFPIILPRGMWVSKLILRSYHIKDGHAARTNHTLANLSQRFWLMHGREEIRQIEKESNTCKIRKAKATGQSMAPPPQVRLVLPLRAFSRYEVGFAGPFITKKGREKKRAKRYFCLFTCLVSRAVHLEIAYGLNTDSFLKVFYRMANRRGFAVQMLSDNGTDTVGVNKN